MVNILIWLDVAHRDEGVRSWIEDRLEEKENLYFVVGYVLLDRTTVQTRDEQLTPLSTSNQERPAVSTIKVWVLNRHRAIASQGSHSRRHWKGASLALSNIRNWILDLSLEGAEPNAFVFSRWTMLEYENDEVLFQPQKPRKERKYWSMKMGKI
ncbi:hypothetical protein CPC08DRAFT_707070 [Agrocybe pediades]|nr:hypothetical protein CPC08DRAFT_707070 [Agrocybe pediades]